MKVAEPVAATGDCPLSTQACDGLGSKAPVRFAAGNGCNPSLADVQPGPSTGRSWPGSGPSLPTNYEAPSAQHPVLRVSIRAVRRTQNFVPGSTRPVPSTKDLD